VDQFPISYSPVRYPFFGINSGVSGVGYNVAKALTTLGNEVRFLSLTGRDPAGELVRSALERDGIPGELVLQEIERTPQSVILYDGEGRRQIHVDLKDVQEQTYPPARFEQAAGDCSLAVLCNVNFSRPLLARARERGLPIATDVHTISDLEDDYNRDFMQHADILFMSDERLPLPPEAWLEEVVARYAPRVAVIGLGAKGALLAIRDEDAIQRVPAVRTRPVVNTIGAGDALFSAFVHFYARSQDAHDALRRAVLFASYKIGDPGAAEGFLDAAGLDALYESRGDAGHPA
jgi:ribokinase